MLFECYAVVLRFPPMDLWIARFYRFLVVPSLAISAGVVLVPLLEGAARPLSFAPPPSLIEEVERRFYLRYPGTLQTPFMLAGCFRTHGPPVAWLVSSSGSPSVDSAGVEALCAAFAAAKYTEFDLCLRIPIHGRDFVRPLGPGVVAY